ncbi:MAG: type II 3-dehydroquinate dehydratase [Motiliproteus sp.]
MNTIFVLNGPNLNLLGTRQPEVYGYETLADIEAMVRKHAAQYDFDVDFRQSNHEGEIVEFIHEAREKAAGIVINPAAYTHTSVAILDALNAYDGKIVEVHLSNVHKREPFRHHSYVSSRADGVIAGLGSMGYLCAIDYLNLALKK